MHLRLLTHDRLVAGGDSDLGMGRNDWNGWVSGSP